jgi:hypothetical protein
MMHSEGVFLPVGMVDADTSSIILNRAAYLAHVTDVDRNALSLSLLQRIAEYGVMEISERSVLSQDLAAAS